MAKKSSGNNTTPGISFSIDRWYVSGKDGMSAIRFELYFNGKQYPPIPAGIRATATDYDNNVKAVEKAKFKVEEEVLEVFDRIKPFDFVKFKKAWLSRKQIVRTKSKTNLKLLFDNYVENKMLKHKTKIGYDCTYNNLNAFHIYNNGESDTLTLEQITENWLHKWRRWNNDNKGRKPNGMGMYERNIKAVYNAALKDSEIWRTVEGNPFGKGKFEVNIGDDETDNYITAAEKDKLIEYRDELYTIQLRTTDKVQIRRAIDKAKAIDYWLMSYHMGGQNAEDCLAFNWRNVAKNKNGHYMVKFKRAKVAHKVKDETELSILPILNQILFTDSPDGFFIPVYERQDFISKNDKERDEKELLRFNKRAYWLKWVNRRLKEVGKELGFHLNMASTRQSFATHAGEKGFRDKEYGLVLAHQGKKSISARYDKGFKLANQAKIVEIQAALADYQKIDEFELADYDELFETGELPELIRGLIEAKIDAAKRIVMPTEQAKIKALKPRKTA